MEIKIVKYGKSRIIYGRYLTENLELGSELLIRSGADFSFLGVITFKMKVLLLYKITINLISKSNSSLKMDISEECYLNEFLQSIIIWIESGEISTNAKYLYSEHRDGLDNNYYEFNNIAKCILGACIHNSDQFLNQAFYLIRLFILANDEEIHNELFYEIADIVVGFFKSKEYLFML